MGDTAGGANKDINTSAPASLKEKYECTRDSECADTQKCSGNKCIPVCQGVSCASAKECIYKGPHAYACEFKDPCMKDPCPADYPVCESQGKEYSCSPCPRGTANFGNGKCTTAACASVPYSQKISGSYPKFCTEHFIRVRYRQPDDSSVRVEFMDGNSNIYHKYDNTPSVTECRCGYTTGSQSWHYLSGTTHLIPKGSVISSISVSAGTASGCNAWSAKTVSKGSEILLTECPGYGTQEATINYSFTATGQRTYCPGDENKNCVDGMCSDQP